MKATALLTLSIALYLIALTLPALHGEGRSLNGLVLLVGGWVEVGGESAAWLANLTFFASGVLFLARRDRGAFYLALISIVVGLDTFRAEHISVDSAGYDIAIEQVGAAFYVWQLSFVVLAIASLLRMSAHDGLKQKPLPDSA